MTALRDGTTLQRVKIVRLWGIVLAVCVPALAVAVPNVFEDGMTLSASQLNDNFTHLESQLAQLNAQIEAVEARVENVEGLEPRVETLETSGPASLELGEPVVLTPPDLDNDVRHYQANGPGLLIAAQGGEALARTDGRVWWGENITAPSADNVQCNGTTCPVNVRSFQGKASVSLPVPGGTEFAAQIVVSSGLSVEPGETARLNLYWYPLDSSAPPSLQ